VFGQKFIATIVLNVVPIFSIVLTFIFSELQIVQLGWERQEE